MKGSAKSLFVVNVIQLIVEAGIAIGYLLGLIPFLYLWSSGWVIPLVIISMILALVAGNRTFILNVVNLVMAILSFIPVAGYVPRMIGMIISLVNINTIRRLL